MHGCLAEADRLPHLLELYWSVHALTGSAGVAGLHNLSQLTAALEVLLKELYDKPKHINGSTVRTVANAIDFLGELFQRELDPHWNTPSAIRILAVDDDAPEIFVSLVSTVMANLHGRSDIRWLALMLAARHPLVAAVRRFASRSYASHLFAVHAPGTSLDLDGRVPHLEGALL